MRHETKIIRAIRLSDGAIAVWVQCCGDPLSDSCLTAYDMEGIEQATEEHRQRAAAQQEKILTAEEKLKELMGQVDKSVTNC